MEPYKLTFLPHPVLRATAQPVTRVDDAVRAQAARMVETMYEAEGIGLAANQVGLLNRVIVLDVARRADGIGDPDARQPLVLINPEIIWSSDEKWEYKEGCLSIPQHYAEVERPFKVRVRYVDVSGQAQEMEGEGLTSSCLQHEIDHLNGVLFIDYLSRLRRNLILKKFEKLARSEGSIL